MGSEWDERSSIEQSGEMKGCEEALKGRNEIHVPTGKKLAEEGPGMVTPWQKILYGG